MANGIRDAIADRRLSPGDRIVERQVAREMSISLTPVREAFQLLEQQGLLLRVPRAGTFVRKLNRRDVVELITLRAVLESFAGRLFVRFSGDEGIAQLEEVLARMEKAASEGSVRDVSSCDLGFHETIVEHSRHQALIRMSASISEKTLVCLTDRNKLYGDLNVVVKDHRRLLDPIVRGDELEAGRSIAAHVLEGGNALLAIMPEDGSDPIDPNTLGLDRIPGPSD